MAGTEGERVAEKIAEKVVVITGAGRGIGTATARLLAARGARVVLVSRSEQELAITAGSIAADGGEVAYQCVDVTQPEDLRALVGLATELFGRLDVLASVAGVAVNAPLQSGELGDWNTMIDVNLRGVLHGIAAALPVFRAQGSGHFITVGSTADPAGLFRGHAARLSSRRARWVVLRRSRGVPFQYASSRSRLRAQAMYTWSRRVFGSPR